MAEHIVQQGECLSSIASDFGYSWKTLWKHPQNAQLKAARKDPNILYPGDIVFIPEKEVEVFSAVTEKRHRFLRRGVPSSIHIILKDRSNQPLANKRYILKIEGRSIEGSTNGQGAIEHFIPPDARSGSIAVPELGLCVPLKLGNLDPVDTCHGVQERLNNLGYPCGEITGEMNDLTAESLRAFQREQGLEPTGQIDDATRQKLKDIHGS